MTFRTFSFILKHPVNKNRKKRALLDWLKWHIGIRLIPGEVVFNWINNSQLFVKAKKNGLKFNVFCGLEEFYDMAYLLHTLSENELFIDVGANDGSYTILAGAVKKAKVFSFEPIPSTFQRLIRNVRLNNIEDRVQGRNIGLSDKKGKLQFTTTNNTDNRVLSKNEKDQNSIEVDVLTLDMVLEKESPSLIKIDVEGFETPVIHGAEKTLSKESLTSVIIELNNSGERYGFSEDEIIKYMKTFDFDTYHYDPIKRDLLPINGKNNLSRNTLFIRNKNKVLEKAKMAPKMEWKGFSF